MTSGDLFHGGDRPREAMEKRLDTLFRVRGDVPVRWVPRRLILQNYWLYPYQEFHFGNGRLVLRGPNGSGKTSVLVSAVTLALDGEKGPSRLDPFRQAGRSIAYYLVGKKDAEEGDGGFYHEDRTGYVAVEFEHGGRGGFVTVGVGMRGRRQSGGGAPRVDSWGFVLRDGRRVGRGRELELTTPEGVPLTRSELAEKVGAGGVIVERVSDYQAEVNRALFGFPEDDDYQFLMQILLALRSPKLNKELKPSDVAEILSDSLPPLDPKLLVRVTQIMDDIDATRLDIATTETNHTRAERVHQAVARHANQVAQECALEYLEHQAAVEEVRDALVEARERASTVGRKRENAQVRLRDVDQERADLQGRLQVLRRHEAYRGQDALLEARKAAARAHSHHESTEAAVREVRGALAASEKQRSGLRDRWTGHRKAARHDAEELAGAARRAAWPHAEQTATGLIDDLRELEFGGGEPPDVPAEALAELASDRRRRLEDVLDALAGVGRAEAEFQRARTGVEETERALEEGHDELRASRENVDDGRDALSASLERWRGEARELSVSVSLLSEVRQDLHRIDEPDGLSVELFQPLLELAAQRREALEAERDRQHARRIAVEFRMKELREQLEIWEGREEAVPEPRAGQVEARTALTDAYLPTVPLFRAVEVGDSLSEEEVRSLQAGLQESGLLDALVVRPRDQEKVADLLGTDGGDRWIRPRPLMERTGTLADVLEPAPCDLPEEVVAAALRSVALGDVVDGGSAGVDIDGRWHLGLLRGRVPAPSDEGPLYLGKEARIRERDRQVSRLRLAIQDLDEELKAVREEVRTLIDRLRRLDSEVEVLRNLPEIQALSRALTVRLERSRHVARLTERLQEAEGKTEAARRAVGNARQVHEAAVRKAPGAQGMDDEGVRRLIQAGEDVVSVAQRVAGRLETLRDQTGEFQRISATMERQQVALDNAGDREREAAEAVAEAQGRARTIERDLQEMGVEEIVEEVRRGEERQAKLEVEGRKLTGTIDRLAERLRHTEAEVVRLGEERAECEADLAAAREKLAEAVRAYPTLGEAATLFGEGTEGAAGRAAEHLLERREDRPTDLRLRIEDDRKRAWQALTHEVTESRSALIDYHPSLDPESDDVSFRHEGRELSAHGLLEVLERHRRHQMSVMREKEDELYEEFFLQEVSGKIREAIERAEESVERVNALLAERPLANEEILWLRWRPLREIGADGADYPRLVELLRRPASVLPPDDVRWVKSFFRERVSTVREDVAGGVDIGGEDDVPFAEALQTVLDYRRWFSFTIHGRRPGETSAEITNREYASRSGGEKSLAMFVPLLAAVDSRFQGARADAPKLVGLDEAFAGVDSDNINEMFAFMVNLDLSWIMTSEKLWGVGASLPICTTYQFHRRGTVAAVRLWLWDGQRNVDEASLALSAPSEADGTEEEEVGAA